MTYDFAIDHYHSLLPFHTARDLLFSNYEAINILGKTIQSHHLEEEIGICLLHKHFELHSNERLIRFYDQLTRHMTVYPVQDINIFSQSIPYICRLIDTFHKGVLAAPVEFLYANHLTGHIDAFHNLPTSALEDIFLCLKDLRAENLFGIGLLPSKTFRVEAEEGIIETENVEDRVLLLRPIYKEELNKLETTQTFWAFNRKKVSTVCFTHCDHTNCYGHVDCVHCPVHCAAHCAHC